MRADPLVSRERAPEIGKTGEEIEVVKYQVVVEREEPILLVFSVDLPPGVTEVEIPSGFIALGDEFKFEILVREASGNQTAVESCFEVVEAEEQCSHATCMIRRLHLLFAFRHRQRRMELRPLCAPYKFLSYRGRPGFI